MKNQNYSTTFSVDQTPKRVFDSINNVRSWWSGEIDGDTDKLGSEFTYRVGNVHHSTQKIIELVPGKKVVWHVAEARLNFTKDKSEWKGTDIVFEIAKKAPKLKSALHTKVWSRHSNATRIVRTRGARLSMEICASSSIRAKRSQIHGHRGRRS